MKLLDLLDKHADAHGFNEAFAANLTSIIHEPLFQNFSYAECDNKYHRMWYALNGMRNGQKFTLSTAQMRELQAEGMELLSNYLPLLGLIALILDSQQADAYGQEQHGMSPNHFDGE